MTKSNVVNINAEKAIMWSEFLNENRGIIIRMQKLAGEIHEGVNQRYDELPYSYHTNMVGALFMQYGSVCFESHQDMENYGLAAIFGALFHDTIEDARLTYNDVKEYAKEFLPASLVGIDLSVLAADIVYALTNEKGKNRAERENDKYFEGIRVTPYAPCIKVCDRYANALYANVRGTSMARKYSSEMANFLSNLVREGVDTFANIPYELYLSLQTYPISTYQAVVKNEKEIEKEQTIEK